MRNRSFIEELSPTCIKIKNNSVDFYFSLGKKLSKRKMQQVIPFLAGLSSEECIQPIKSPSVPIKNTEHSIYKRKLNNHPLITLPKITDIHNYKFLVNTKPLTEKLKIKKYPSKKLLVIKKSQPLTQNSSPRLLSPVKNKIITKVGYKEASRYSEWSMIAKGEIEELWRNLICLSNGIKSIQQKPQQYKYFIGTGNNSAIIKRLLAMRSSWIPTENPLEANFIWTQWKDKNIVSTIPSVKEKNYILDFNSNPSITYQVPVRMNEVFRQVDLSDLGLFKIKNSNSYAVIRPVEFSSPKAKLYNKFEFNQHLANKKGLYRNLKSFYELIGSDIFNYHPITFHIKNTENDEEYKKFLESFQKFEKKKANKKTKNLWILKPGENSNRGNGIHLCKKLSEINEIISDSNELKSSNPRTFILQKYIERPFLINNRKFDIRCYALVTGINGVIQGYFYNDGYLRTSSCEYSLKNTSNNLIHLTNDAIQKHSEDYGKFEDNNKLSYKDFQRYLDYHQSDKKINFLATILPQIKNIVKDTIQAVFLKIDKNNRHNSMEIFGYDFMLDYNLKPWIIEVNTNPCLELASSYLSYLIPAMLVNSFRITLDCLFPANGTTRNSFEPLPENRFDLIFHELIDGEKLKDKINDNAEESEISDADNTAD